MTAPAYLFLRIPHLVARSLGVGIMATSTVLYAGERERHEKCIRKREEKEEEEEEEEEGSEEKGKKDVTLAPVRTGHIVPSCGMDRAVPDGLETTACRDPSARAVTVQLLVANVSDRLYCSPT